MTGDRESGAPRGADAGLPSVPEARALRPLGETDGYPIAVDEEILFTLRPDAEDVMGLVGMTTGFLTVPSVLMVALGLAPPGFGWAEVAALALIGAAVGGISALFRSAPTASHLIVTDRGLHTRRHADRYFIPWKDVVSVDAIAPYTGGWRVVIREGAPVLDEIPPPRWWDRILGMGGGPGTRLVAVGKGGWDFRHRKLQLIEDAMDDWAVEDFGHRTDDDA